MWVVCALRVQSGRLSIACNGAFRSKLFTALNAAKHPNILTDAIFVNLHLFRAQIRHGMVVLVSNHQIEEHFPCGRMNYSAARIRGDRGTGLAEQCRESD